MNRFKYIVSLLVFNGTLGGKNMMTSISKLIQLSNTEIILVQKEDLYHSRIKKIYSTKTCYLLKIAGNSGIPDEGNY